MSRINGNEFRTLLAFFRGVKSARSNAPLRSCPYLHPVQPGFVSLWLEGRREARRVDDKPPGEPYYVG
jgi:ribosome modulation factor